MNVKVRLVVERDMILVVLEKEKLSLVQLFLKSYLAKYFSFALFFFLVIRWKEGKKIGTKMLKHFKRDEILQKSHDIMWMFTKINITSNCHNISSQEHTAKQNEMKMTF